MTTEPNKANGAEVVTELVVAERPAALTPVDLLRIAVTQGADIEKLKQLMDLQERFEAKEARKAFWSAMNKFKSNPPDIKKNKLVQFDTQKGQTSYRHATLDHVCDEVTKGLSAVGITHAWKVAQEKDGLITVTCVLTHELGHSENTQLMGFPDDSGGKNKIQGIGSTCTYLQRYTLLSACGLAAGNDTDGKSNGEPFIEASVLEKNLEEISHAKDAATLKFLFSVAYDKAREINDRKAMAHYITAKDKKKQEFANAPR